MIHSLLTAQSFILKFGSWIQTSHGDQIEIEPHISMDSHIFPWISLDGWVFSLLVGWIPTLAKQKQWLGIRRIWEKPRHCLVADHGGVHHGLAKTCQDGRSGGRNSPRNHSKQTMTQPIPIGSMYGIYIYANMTGVYYGILMVNVTIYSIHGSYGIWMIEQIHGYFDCTLK